MTQISLQLPDDLLSQVQALAGSPENIQGFLIHAIEQEVQRASSQRLTGKQHLWHKLIHIQEEIPHQQSQQLTGEQDEWHKLQQLHAEMLAEGIEIKE